MTSIHDRIALRAYFLWEGEGHPQGRHEHHWFSAEAAEPRPAAVETAAAVEAVEPAAPVKAAASKKPAPARKANPTKPAPAKVAAPKAPAEAVVAAASLAAPRAGRTAKGARGAH